MMRKLMSTSLPDLPTRAKPPRRKTRCPLCLFFVCTTTILLDRLSLRHFLETRNGDDACPFRRPVSTLELLENLADFSLGRAFF